MNHGFVFDLDPILVRLGPLKIRYYGIIFFLTLWTGYLLWRRQMLRGGHSEHLANRFLIWGVIAVLAGARLGHCLFYNPWYYLSHPLEILYFFEGGLASHGATIGLFVALLFFCRKYHLGLIEMMDRLSMSAALAAAGIRLGNFLNSEVVGRATSLPWAVRFVRYDGGEVARHPSQLYEFGLGVFVLGVVYFADRWAGREKRPPGLLCGLFFAVYFTGRFLVEFVKEYQVFSGPGLTMGQYLSLVPFAAGIGLLVWAWRARTQVKSTIAAGGTGPADSGQTVRTPPVARSKRRPRSRKKK